MAYIPTEQEIYDCNTGKGCEYGICDECSVCVKEESEDNESEE